MKAIIRAIRFSEEEYKIAKEVAEKLGIEFSDFVRLALREKLARMSFLDAKTKKVFGIIEGGEKR